MELNSIKLYGRIIDLQVGEIFWQNTTDGTIHYQPSKENLDKIPRGGDQWYRNKYISCEKYRKQILKADNIELNPLSGTNGHYMKEYIVKYVYKDEHPQIDDLILMRVGKERDWNNEGIKFEVVEVPVERVTKEMIFLKDGHDIAGYGVKFQKDDLLKVQYKEHYPNVVWGMCFPDDYEKLQDLLFKGLQERLKSLRIAAKIKLEEAEGIEKDFETFRSKHGYV